ncbi:MAG TPA: MarR family transcriptional regulator [Acidimicrobiales bacterium]|nr:MarR family transcriptional regulator [Acidimicrobiales bacterium]
MEPQVERRVAEAAAAAADRDAPEAAAAERAAVDAVMSASRALVAVAARSLAGTGEEVTVPQYRALVVLASRGPRNLAQLADSLAVKPSTASRMCDRLVRKRFVTRRAGPGDRRSVEVALSESGRRLVDEVTARRRLELERLLASVPLDEQRAIAASLRRFAAAAGEPADGEWDAVARVAGRAPDGDLAAGWGL